jgi:multiple sugar transport system permease protein
MVKERNEQTRFYHPITGFFKSRHNRHIIGAVATYSALTLFAVVFLIPFFWQVTSALKTPAQIFAYPIKWIPPTPQWQNFYNVWTALPFHLFYKNSIIITASVILGRLTVCTVVAYGFAKKEFFGKNVLFVLLLGTMMIPYHVTMIPLFAIYRILGWIDTYAPLIVPAFFARDAFSVFLMRQFLLTIPNELEESAVLDGAGSITVFTRIYLPLCKPALISVAIFAFMLTWNDFIQPLIYLNTKSMYTLTLGLRLFQEEYEIEWHLFMAASIQVILPCLVVFFLTQRYFVEGIALTGMKS